ncbi:MAG: peptide-methionine (S)-S-oxide reductase MsrA [Solobacterium sp.]|nr:peptide-methionine (S)-S-oxide reductase MsrA [Solobacterium sp.]
MKNDWSIIFVKKEIYFAGGCFWGMERAFQELNGVMETTVGYANGTADHPTYEQVCSDTTGHRETVKVVYDPEKIRLAVLLKAYFICIDPTMKNRQGEDIGSQYQTGIYTVDEESYEAVKKAAEEEKRRYPVFFTEIAMLKCFWPAEEYHQDYLKHHPQGYCHIAAREFEQIRQLNQEGAMNV